MVAGIGVFRVDHAGQGLDHLQVEILEAFVKLDVLQRDGRLAGQQGQELQVIVGEGLFFAREVQVQHAEGLLLQLQGDGYEGVLLLLHPDIILVLGVLLGVGDEDGLAGLESAAGYAQARLHMGVLYHFFRNVLGGDYPQLVGLGVVDHQRAAGGIYQFAGIVHHGLVEFLFFYGSGVDYAYFVDGQEAGEQLVELAPGGLEGDLGPARFRRGFVQPQLIDLAQQGAQDEKQDDYDR